MNRTLTKSETYECFGVIGRGSFSNIYDGYDHELKRDVVIKELRAEFREDAEVVEGFWGEATVLAGLNHTNILRVYAIDRERFWIVMEPMQGSLSADCCKAGMEASRVREILKQLLEGLRYLHLTGRCHGQLRLESLLVDPQGNIRLSNIAEGLHEGEFPCPNEKNLHCAPEILNPKHFGQPGLNADLYSVGIMGLQMLAGEKFIKFFKGMDRKRQNDPIAWSAWHASSEAIAPVGSIVPNVPADLGTLIDGLAQKQAGLRFATASEALGVVSHQSASHVSAGITEHQGDSGDTAEMSSSDATVVYNSPNLFSPKFASRNEPQPALWNALLKKAGTRLKPLRSPKSIVAITGGCIGVLFLLMALQPTDSSQSDVPTVAEQKEETESTPTGLQKDAALNFASIDDLEIVPAPEIGTVRLAVRDEDDALGTSIESIEVFINGTLQSVKESDFEEAGAPDPTLDSDMLDRSPLDNEDLSAFTLVRKELNGPISITGPVGIIDLEIRASKYQAWRQQVVVAVEGADQLVELSREVYKVPFEIEPVSATLFVDGKPFDPTGRKLRFVPLPWGTYNLEVAADGYQGMVTQKEIASDEKQEFILAQVPEVPTVSMLIESFPNGADVMIDGVAAGKTPLVWNGPAKSYPIELKLKGFELFKDTFELAPQENKADPPCICWYLKRSEDSTALGQNSTTPIRLIGEQK